MAARRGKNQIDRKQTLRNRFRTLVRHVIFNKNWLQDAEEHEGISLNVKRNIAMLLRKRQQTGILTLYEKSLIQTPHSLRTVDERKRLVNVIAGLKCFEMFPPKVRARLVPYVKFMSVPADRTILRKGHKPSMVYFILSGEVEVRKIVQDSKEKREIAIVEQVKGGGDVLGAVGVLENSPRLFTCVTKSNVEMLSLFRDEYEVILKPFMGKLWQQMKDALHVLGYFDYLNSVQRLMALTHGTLKLFNPLETIFSGYESGMNSVLFIVSGECVMLQNLKMRVIMEKGVKKYQLVDIVEGDSQITLSKEKTEELMKTLDTGAKRNNVKTPKVGGVEAIEAQCKQFWESFYAARKSEASEISLKSSHEIFNVDSGSRGEEESYGFHGYYDDTDTNTKFTASESDSVNNARRGSSRNLGHKPSKMGTEEMNEEMTETSYSSTSAETKTSKYKGDSSLQKERIEDHFVDVGCVTFGGIVGLGEKWEHRVLIARTNIVCFALSRLWLFQKEQNPNNIWNRRLLYIKNIIPSREKLFEDFLLSRKWRKFKWDLIEENVRSNKLSAASKVQDIPAILHIIEDENDNQ